MRCRRRDPIPEEVRRTADLLERRWTLSILYASVEGAERFNALVVPLVEAGLQGLVAVQPGMGGAPLVEVGRPARALELAAPPGVPVAGGRVDPRAVELVDDEERRERDEPVEPRAERLDVVED